ncbi:uncharacterized protein LOC144227592 [Crocuta crocuta]
MGTVQECSAPQASQRLGVCRQPFLQERRALGGTPSCEGAARCPRDRDPLCLPERLRARSGCLQIYTLSSAALLPVTLHRAYDESLLILQCSQHPLAIKKFILHNNLLSLDSFTPALLVFKAHPHLQLLLLLLPVESTSGLHVVGTTVLLWNNSKMILSKDSH